MDTEVTNAEIICSTQAPEKLSTLLLVLVLCTISMITDRDFSLDMMMIF